MSPQWWAPLLVLLVLPAAQSSDTTGPQYTPKKFEANGPIGPCLEIGSAETQCAVSCSSTTEKQRHPYLVLSLEFVDGDPEKPLAKLLDLVTRTKFEAAVGGGRHNVVNIDTCKAGSSTAFKSKHEAENFAVGEGWLRPSGDDIVDPAPQAALRGMEPMPAFRPWFKSSSTRGKGDDLLIRPCVTPMAERDCWVSCRVVAGAPVAVQLLSMDLTAKQMVVADQAGAEYTLDEQQMNTCKRSSTAWGIRANFNREKVRAPVRPAKVAKVAGPVYPPLATEPLPRPEPVSRDRTLQGNVWEEEYSTLEEDALMKKGVPLGGGVFVKLRDLYSVLKRAAPVDNLTSRVGYNHSPQRIYEAPYTLPRYRVEINVVTGEVFVTMPPSKRFLEANDGVAPTAVEYLTMLFDAESGTLPMGVDDMSVADRDEFKVHCSWSDTAYLWVVAPMMTTDHTEIDSEHFRVVVSPECRTHFNGRVIKHGDLAPLETPIGRVHGSKSDSPQMKTAHILACHTAGARFMEGDEGYLEPSWADATSTTTLFEGNCRGPAHMAGELYIDRGSRAARKSVKVYSDHYDAGTEASQWFVDADSSYTFMRDGGEYTGVEAMLLLKEMLGAMHVDIGNLWVNTAGTSASQDVDHQIKFKIPRNVAVTDPIVTPLARDESLERPLAAIYTPTPEGDKGFPAVLPSLGDSEGQGGGGRP